MLLVVVSHRQVQYKASNLSLKICHFHRIFDPFVTTVALFDRKLHLLWIILNMVPNIKRQYWRFERKNSKLCACHLTDFFGRDKLISRIGKFTTSCGNIFQLALQLSSAKCDNFQFRLPPSYWTNQCETTTSNFGKAWSFWRSTPFKVIKAISDAKSKKTEGCHARYFLLAPIY